MGLPYVNLDGGFGAHAVAATAGGKVAMQRRPRLEPINSRDINLSGLFQANACALLSRKS